MFRMGKFWLVTNEWILFQEYTKKRIYTSELKVLLKIEVYYILHRYNWTRFWEKIKMFYQNFLFNKQVGEKLFLLLKIAI